MSRTVTGLDLDRLEALAEKATGAPWEAKVYRFPNMAGPKWPEISGGRVLRDGGTMLVTDQVHYADDAEFIAEFRNAVPSLLAAARIVQRLNEDETVERIARLIWSQATNESWDKREAQYPQSADLARARRNARAVVAALGTEQEGQQ